MLFRSHDVIFSERTNRAADAGVDNELEQRESGAERVSSQSEGGRCGEEAVHHIVRIRSETDEEEQLRTILDGSHDAFDRQCAGEPVSDTRAEERPCV